jgi:hypothetical protein
LRYSQRGEANRVSPPNPGSRRVRATDVSAHREAAQHALEHAQSNPIMSAEQSFTVAQVHVLLAIEQRLGELVDQLRTRGGREIIPSEAI